MSEILVGSDPTVVGTDGHDIFRSDQPNQYIITGSHTLVGGAGDDWYYVTSSTKIVEQPNGGADIATSATSYVLPDNVETLIVWGTSAAFGNNQNNTLIGSSAANLFDGKGGNDILQGGGGADTYQFSAASGHDTITAWNSSSTVRLPGYGQFQSLADVQAAMTQVGDDVVLKLSANDDVTFSHTKVADFTASNFQYRLDSSHMTLSFDDEFNTLSTRDSRSATTGTWDTELGGGANSDQVEARTLQSNGERELYVDPGFKGTTDTALGLNPFSIDNGVLTITAAPTEASVKDALSGYDYTSGYLSTRDTFAQTYGYFEARMQLSSGQGSWPAFWMFRKDGQWPPELDIMEAWNDSTAVQTVHTEQLGFHQTSSASSYVPDGDTSFHNYGFLWTAEKLTWYLDGVAVFSAPTPADMHSPMYLILNLAISSGVQDPNFTTQLKVDYVHAYTLDNMPIPAEDVIDPTTGHGYWGKEPDTFDGFNAAYYLAHNPDVAAAGVTPITHYAQFGKAEGRLPYEGADPTTAPVAVPPASDPPATATPDPSVPATPPPSTTTPANAATVHAYWGADTSKPDNFNAAYYAAHNPDVVASGLDLLGHYEQYGKAEGRLAYDPNDTATATEHSYWGAIAGQPGGFNADYYGTHNPDVVAAGLDLLSHYKQYGKAEGRLAYDPSAPATPPAQPDPGDTTPVATTPVDTTPVVTHPVDPTPVVTTPVNPAPVVTTPVDPAPVVTHPVDPAPVVTTPVDPTPVVTTPVNPAPVVTAPVETTPGTAPVTTPPVGTTPMHTTPGTPPVTTTDPVAVTATHVFWGADPGQPDGFNAAYYAAKNPDVAASGLDLLAHYEQYGKAEGRLAYDPTDVATATRHPSWGAVASEPDGFNAAYYAAHNPDVVATGLNLLDHYERYGKAEGRLPYDPTTDAPKHVYWGADLGQPDGFNAVYYAAHNPDVVASGLDLLTHYEQYGKAEGRLAYDPTDVATATRHAFWGAVTSQPDGFNADYYAAHNPDVVASGLNLLDHYEEYGKSEGRLAYDSTATQAVTATQGDSTSAPASVPNPTPPVAPVDTTPVVAATGDPTTVHAMVETKLALDQSVLYLEGNAKEGWANATGSTLFANPLGGSTLHGGDGNDTLHASGLGDTLIGGNGDDTYWVGSKQDKVIESANGGWDTVESTVDFHAPAGIEQVKLSGNAVNAWANTTGTILVGDARDNHLYGSKGNDSLSGGDGNDLLDSGVGNDQLTGGAGKDTFVFKPGVGHDTITDFKLSEDKLDVSALIAKYGAPTVTDISYQPGSMVHFSGGETILLLGVSHADALAAVHV